ncbi:MAG: sensor domain-containing diguanylate cyclase [Treponema sp.]|nr:sensor domain-containing diguanylate cyclase [Treponema sp.]MCL2237622.1 sensor domain-containing diguanylate cyclase [Treponema sp.]
MKNRKNAGEKSAPVKQRYKGLSSAAVISSLVSLAFCAFVVSATIIDRTKVNNLSMEQQIFERTHKISETIQKLLYKTEALAALIYLDSVENFDIIAPSIVDDPAIRNILLAPNGIVTKVYPLAGNEGVLGLNFFSEGAGNKEAVMARDLGALVMGGPFNLVQGGKAIVGRLPVYIDTHEDEKKFWGLVSVTLDFPKVLEYAELEVFTTFGYTYELWRINPDTNLRQVIDSGDKIVITESDYFTNYNYLEKPINIFNAEWFLRISPIKKWHQFPENIILIVAGICISVIVFLVMQNNYQLKNMQHVFELMAITDPLTGIFNRRHFLEIVRIGIEKARRLKENCYFIMMDIDRFKLVNDTYGHQIGDKVLMDVSARIKADIRPYDLFARYGGEEFIIYASGITKKEVIDMTERLRLSLCTRKYVYDDISFMSSASFGIALIEDTNLDKAIKQSDEALYTAKRNGRNCVVYFEEELINSEKPEIT